ANNFFIDEADQLHRNCDQRTYLGHLPPLSSALLRAARCVRPGRASSVIWPAAYPDSVPAVTRRHPSPARSGGIESNTEEMTVSKEREVAVRKEMAGVYEKRGACGGEGGERACGAPPRLPSTRVPVPTTPLPSPTTTPKPAPATMHSLAVEPMPSAAMAISAISVLRNIDFSS